ncbi:MAG: YbaK/EbsC family protein [Chloroflexota bacterium]|nr:YbaK/EbsC family protein [Chloroflexota bacterium]
MVEKTNAMRLLDAQQVTYEVITFSPDIHSAEGVAEVAGVSPSEVYKTLVVRRQQGKPLLVMIAGDRELDLKRLAQVVGEKKLKMATYRQAEEWTGLQVGGISPLALLNRGFEVYIDHPATDLSHVCVSAGRRGINLRVPVEDLVAITKAKVVEVTGEVG